MVIETCSRRSSTVIRFCFRPGWDPGRAAFVWRKTVSSILQKNDGHHHIVIGDRLCIRNADSSLINIAECLGSLLKLFFLPFSSAIKVRFKLRPAPNRNLTTNP